MGKYPQYSPSARIVQRFANEIVGPKVREMDENEQMDPVIIQGLFDQGVGTKLSSPWRPTFMSWIIFS